MGHRIEFHLPMFELENRKKKNVIFDFLQKAEIVTKEKNRASAVAMNAEIRRIKARFAEEVPKLQRLALKRVSFLSLLLYLSQ